MKTYRRNPKHTESSDVRSQNKKAALEQSNGQQNQQSQEGGGEEVQGGD